MPVVHIPFNLISFENCKFIILLFILFNWHYDTQYSKKSSFLWYDFSSGKTLCYHSVNPSVGPSVHPFVRPSVRPFVRSFVCATIFSWTIRHTEPTFSASVYAILHYLMLGEFEFVSFLEMRKKWKIRKHILLFSRSMFFLFNNWNTVFLVNSASLPTSERDTLTCTGNNWKHGHSLEGMMIPINLLLRILGWIIPLISEGGWGTCAYICHPKVMIPSP